MLIAIADEDRVYLAVNLFDNEDMRQNLCGAEDYKLEDNLPLWKADGCVVGGVGDMAERDLIRYDGRLFRGEIDVRTLTDRIFPELKERLASFGKINKEGEMDGEYIVARASRAYWICCNGAIEEIDDYLALSGSSSRSRKIAEASLAATAGLSPRERIVKAFSAAERILFTPACPIAVIDTKTEKLQIIESCKEGNN